MSFQEALQARLELINVSQATVEAFLADHPPRLSPGRLIWASQPATAIARCTGSKQESLASAHRHQRTATQTLMVSNAGIPELVKRLQELRKDVFLVSGGFRPIINPIAEMLGIPLDHVYANTILYQVLVVRTLCA